VRQLVNKKALMISRCTVRMWKCRSIAYINRQCFDTYFCDINFAFAGYTKNNKNARSVCIHIIPGQYLVRFSVVPLWNIRHKSLKHSLAASVHTYFTGILITGLCHNCLKFYPEALASSLSYQFTKS
jgi:hypothetical protein